MGGTGSSSSSRVATAAAQHRMRRCGWWLDIREAEAGVSERALVKGHCICMLTTCLLFVGDLHKLIKIIGARHANSWLVGPPTTHIYSHTHAIVVCASECVRDKSPGCLQFNDGQFSTSTLCDLYTRCIRAPHRPHIMICAREIDRDLVRGWVGGRV